MQKQGPGYVVQLVSTIEIKSKKSSLGFVKSGNAFWKRWNMRSLSKENVRIRLFEVGGSQERVIPSRIKTRVKAQQEE